MTNNDLPYLAILANFCPVFLPIFSDEVGRVYFLGKIKREKLPEIYSAADLFLFPSTTDTFGMVVLEAQACGVPALVTDKGGPKNIILPEETGYTLPINEPNAWISKIEEIISSININNYEWNLKKQKAIENAKRRFKWEIVLQSILLNQ
jgi:glycosyltransferase involved in cell wall biosynthesis